MICAFSHWPASTPFSSSAISSSLAKSARYRWRKAHREAWRNPSHGIMMFRLARARAAGVSYREYMLELLDTGRHLQAEDVSKRKEDD